MRCIEYVHLFMTKGVKLELICFKKNILIFIESDWTFSKPLTQQNILKLQLLVS